MIQRKDILSIPFLKKMPFTGSYLGMRYRLEKVTIEEEIMLKATIWEGPYAFDATAEESKESTQFPFSEEGICQSVDWLNQQYQNQAERWKNAVSNWQRA